MFGELYRCMCTYVDTCVFVRMTLQMYIQGGVCVHIYLSNISYLHIQFYIYAITSLSENVYVCTEKELVFVLAIDL